MVVEEEEEEEEESRRRRRRRRRRRKNRGEDEVKEEEEEEVVTLLHSDCIGHSLQSVTYTVCYMYMDVIRSHLSSSYFLCIKTAQVRFSLFS